MIIMKVSHLSVSAEDWSQDPLQTEHSKILKFLKQKGIAFTITYSHHPSFFKSSLHYLKHLIQCKCYVNSWMYCLRKNNKERSLYMFRRYVHFFQMFFDPWLIKFADAVPTDRGPIVNTVLYTSFPISE
jgi:hypothetical protein